MAGGRSPSKPARKARTTTRWLISVLAAGALVGGGWCLVKRRAPVTTAGVHTDRARRTPAPRWQSGVMPGGREAPPPGRKPEGAFVPTGDRVAPGDDGPGPHLAHYGGRTGRLAANRKLGPIDVKVEVASTGKQPELLVWLPSLRVNSDGTLIQARVRPAPDDRPRVVAEIAVAEGAEQIPSQFRSMAPRGDGDAGGAEFEWRFRPERQPSMKEAGAFTPPPQAIRYLVRVRGQLGSEPFERTAGGIFYLHRPGGRLAPDQLRVTRVDGDLVVTTQAVIERPGTYWAYAELWGQGDSGQNGESGEAGARPVAFARERLANLSAGRHPVRLLFGGLVIRDSGIDGPYVVRNLRFQQVDTHPPHESAPRAALPATPGWKASEFH